MAPRLRSVNKKEKQENTFAFQVVFLKELKKHFPRRKFDQDQVYKGPFQVVSKDANKTVGCRVKYSEKAKSCVEIEFIGDDILKSLITIEGVTKAYLEAYDQWLVNQNKSDDPEMKLVFELVVSDEKQIKEILMRLPKTCHVGYVYVTQNDGTEMLFSEEELEKIQTDIAKTTSLETSNKKTAGSTL